MSTVEEALKAKPLKNAHIRAAVNIMHTAAWVQNNVTQALKDFDISEPQFNVLRILRGQHGNPIPLYEVQNRMIQKMSNVSRIVDKLIEKGLVIRKVCEGNRRMVDIFITKKGLTLLENADSAVESSLEAIFSEMKKDKVKQLNKLLDEVRGND